MVFSSDEDNVQGSEKTPEMFLRHLDLEGGRSGGQESMLGKV